MSAGTWSSAPFTVHVNGDPEPLVAAARSAGALVLRWSLEGLHTQAELDESAASVFEFPFPSASLDGLVDMLSDLEWFEIGGGVLLVIDAKNADPSVVTDVAGILPPIADSWRSASIPFEAYVVGVQDVAAVSACLEETNALLDEAGRVPWSRSDISRVPVVFH